MQWPQFNSSTATVLRLPHAKRYRSWLLAKGSMTQRLERFSGAKIGVKILSQRWAKPNLAEQQQLALPANRYCLIREVELHAAGKVLLLARSVLPQGALTKQYQMLPGLVQTTIGKWFYKNPKFNRSDFCVQKVTVANQQSCWARRSLLTTPEQRLLLTEIFMPILFEER